MPLTPQEIGGRTPNGVYPVPIGHCALIESDIAMPGAVATNCTIALGFKPTGTLAAPLNDPTGHYLLTIQKQGNTVRVWKQGVELTAYTGTIGATYGDSLANVLTHYSGSAKGYYSRVVMTEQVLAYTDFWQCSDFVTGLWVPKQLTITYDANDCLYEFGNAASLGSDSSGNGNDATVTGSQTVDTPTNNYCTWNPLIATQNTTYSEGNTIATMPAVTNYKGESRGTISAKSGKYYIETELLPQSGLYWGAWGLVDPAEKSGDGYATGTCVASSGYIRVAGSAVQSGLTGVVAGDVIGMAFDMDIQSVQFYLNNVAYGTAVAVPDNVVPFSFNHSTTTGFGQKSKLITGATGFTYHTPRRLFAPVFSKSSRPCCHAIRKGRTSNPAQWYGYSGGHPDPRHGWRAGFCEYQRPQPSRTLDGV